MIRACAFSMLSMIPLLFLAACAGAKTAPDPLNAAADAYVRLVLAVGRHDPNYVDAYYGPPEWKVESDTGSPVPVADLVTRARRLRDQVEAAPTSDRREFLVKQLAALEAFLRRLSGERATLAEEARGLYDIDLMPHPVAEFEAALARLEAVIPGEGPLRDRVEALRRRCLVPADRLEAVTAKALELSRAATRARIALPPGERFRVELVHGKPWGAYNWYQGSFTSLIQIDTDLPSDVSRVLGTMVHEGYPGHHTYNALLEEHLVRGRGWREFTVYPLYSPQSLLAEGTANVGSDILFAPEERARVTRDELAPIAGIDPRDVDAWESVQEAMKPLRYVRVEAARMLLDEARPGDEVVGFLSRYALLDDERARKAVDFSRTYRSYVVNYVAGEDLVRAWIGDGPDRDHRFFDLLQRPATPSGLAATLPR